MDLNSKKLLHKKKLFDIRKLVEGNFQNVKYQSNNKVDKSFYDSIFKTMYISNLCINEILSILKEFNLSEHSKILKKIYISQQYLVKNTIQNFQIKIDNEKTELIKKLNKKNNLKIKLNLRSRAPQNQNYIYKQKSDSFCQEEKIEKRDKKAKELFSKIENNQELKLENIADPYIIMNLNKLIANDILKNNTNSNKIFENWIEKNNRLIFNCKKNEMKNNLEEIILGMNEKKKKIDEKEKISENYFDVNNIEYGDFDFNFENFNKHINYRFGKGYEIIVKKMIEVFKRNHNVKKIDVYVQTVKDDFLIRKKDQIEDLKKNIFKLDRKILENENKFSLLEIDYFKNLKDFEKMRNEKNKFEIGFLNNEEILKKFDKKIKLEIESRLDLEDTLRFGINKIKILKDKLGFVKVKSFNNFSEKTKEVKVLKKLVKKFDIKENEKNSHFKLKKFNSCINIFNNLLNDITRETDNILIQLKIKEINGNNDNLENNIKFNKIDNFEKSIIKKNRKKDFKRNNIDVEQKIRNGEKIKKNEIDIKGVLINYKKNKFIKNFQKFQILDFPKNILFTTNEILNENISLEKTTKKNSEKIIKRKNLEKIDYYNKKSKKGKEFKKKNSNFNINLPKIKKKSFTKINTLIKSNSKIFLKDLKKNEGIINNKEIIKIEENIKKKNKKIHRIKYENKEKKLKKEKSSKKESEKKINSKKNSEEKKFKLKKKKKINEEKIGEKKIFSKNNNLLENNNNQKIEKTIFDFKNKNSDLGLNGINGINVENPSENFFSNSLNKKYTFKKKKIKDKNKNIYNLFNFSIFKKKSCDDDWNFLKRGINNFNQNDQFGGYFNKNDFDFEKVQKNKNLKIQNKKKIDFERKTKYDFNFEKENEIYYDKKNKIYYDKKNDSLFEKNSNSEKSLNFEKISQFRFSKNSENILRKKNKKTLQIDFTKNNLRSKSNNIYKLKTNLEKKKIEKNFSNKKNKKFHSPNLQNRLFKKRKSLNLKILNENPKKLNTFSKFKKFENTSFLNSNEKRKKIEKNYLFKKIQNIIYSKNIRNSKEKKNFQNKKIFDKKNFKKKINHEFNLFYNEYLSNISSDLIDQFYNNHFSCFPNCNHFENFKNYLKEFLLYKKNENFCKIPILKIGMGKKYGYL